MDAKDWYDCGARIGDLVQKAIDSQDFGSLNESIMRTVGQSIDNAADSVQQAMGIKGKQAKDSYRSSGNAYQQAKKEANTGDMFEGGVSGFRRNSKGIFSMVAGYGMAVMSGLAGLAMLVLSWIFGVGGFRIGAVFFMILAAIFALVGAKGGNYRARMKQLEQYLKIMDGRDVVTIEELASGTGQSVKQVRKDLKGMIKDGMFASEAYLDSQENNLMTSREAYKQYQDTMKAYEQRRAQQQAGEAAAAERSRVTEEQRRAAEKDLASYSDETRKILEEGRDFIAHIHECNEAIPDEEMTAKLDRLEQVVARIFDQVAAKPDSAPDLHRMMSYYLPVTRKLVDAYVEIQDAGIGGENITKTRGEIEMSLDTINLAFETFLDGFYQDTAWDISSDISAMTTMMARDGLTGGKDFDRVRTVGKDVSKMSGAVMGAGGAAAALPEEEKVELKF